MSSIDKITVLALDVDGVLTDGTFAFDPNTKNEIKFFNAQDGMGISLWIDYGYTVVLISGRSAQCVDQRAEELGIKFVIQGSKNKIKDLEQVLDSLGANPKQVCFVGDDLGDIPIMEHVGYSIAVQNAADEVRSVADWITPRSGGHGAVRDAIEYILKSQKIWDSRVSSSMSKHSNQ